MSMKQAREVYEMIGEDEVLQEELKVLKSEEKVIDKVLQIAEERGIDVTGEDIQALHEELVEQAEEMQEDELGEVAGGGTPRAEGVCEPVLLTSP